MSNGRKKLLGVKMTGGSNLIIDTSLLQCLMRVTPSPDGLERLFRVLPKAVAGRAKLAAYPQKRRERG